jgi:hypothetical protein
VSRTNLCNDHDFMLGVVDLIVECAARGRDAMRARVRAFGEIGIDELIFDPTVPKLDQVDLLADAVFDR